MLWRERFKAQVDAAEKTRSKMKMVGGIVPDGRSSLGSAPLR